MRVRPLGSTGVVVSPITLGCNNPSNLLAPDELERVIHAAVDLGIQLFDTADVYGMGTCEEILGRALGKRRDSVLVATKFSGRMGEGPNDGGASRLHVQRAVEASLRRLGTDVIDLYQLHAPDSATPVEETLSALDDLVRQGKVRYIGLSNAAAWQVVEAEMLARTARLHRFVTIQNRCNLYDLDAECDTLQVAQRYGIGYLAYTPLAMGLLSGKYDPDGRGPQDARLSLDPNRAATMLTPTNLALVAALHDLVEATGRSMVQLALGTLLARPGVTSAVCGARTPAQLEALVAACTEGIDDETIGAVERIREVWSRGDA
jgi:aryl-alcohol dehydrogenase-like predicted oxidoreductase